jgi:sugar lactone lactonase YvrE
VPQARSRERLSAIRPLWAVEGGRVDIDATLFPFGDGVPPNVRIGDLPARVVFASSLRIGAIVPSGLEGGSTSVRVEGLSGETAFLEIGSVLASGLHQVDNPVFDLEGNLYVTFSGSRGESVPVSIFKVRPDGTRESFVSGIVNATSLAMDAQGSLHVSSRFDGAIYRVNPDGSYESVATELGAACGLAFAPDGSLFVGDRSGTIFHVELGGETRVFATLPASVAAFHLAIGPDEALYVTAPTLDAYDHVYRLGSNGTLEIVHSGFGRPQGIAFGPDGCLYIVEALAGSSGLYRMRLGSQPELAVSAPALVGVAFDRRGGLVVTSNEVAYRLEFQSPRLANQVVRPDGLVM